MAAATPGPLWFALVSLAFSFSSCALKKKAVNTLAEVLSEAETVYLSDEDPDLIEAAMPFNLKTLETLLQSNPRHEGLLLTAVKSFILYTYGFVEPKADRVRTDDYQEAEAVRKRAARLYRRAYRYGLRGLEIRHPGFGAELPLEPEETVESLDKKDVPLAVWTAAALGSAIGVSLDDAESTADIAVVGALLERALELDEGYEEGTIHEFLISYEVRKTGGSVDKARLHLEKALQMSGGRRCGIWVTWAESVSVSRQSREEFEEYLRRVLEFDLDSAPERRLLNTLAQRRARWLLERIDEFFL